MGTYAKLARLAVVGAACALGSVQAFAGACTSVAGNLVSNCGFEDATDSVPGWSLNATATFVVDGSFDGMSASSGNNFLALGAITLGSLSQTILDTAGKTLKLTYMLAGSADNAAPNFFSAMWNGATIAGSTVSNVGSFPYTLYSFNVLATGSDTLQFNETDLNYYLALDDVTLVQSATNVPEPATLGLLGLGMLGLGALRRRRQRA